MILFRMYKGLPKPIYVIFIAYIINNIGNFVGPFLTLYLTDQLGYKEEIVGIFVAISAFSGLFASLLGGSLIDRLGRRNFLLFTRITGGILYILCGFLKDPRVIPYLLLITSFIINLSLPVFGTMVSDLTKGEQRKAAYSLNYLAMNIGFAVGPVLAGFLYQNHLIWLFLGDGITLMLSGLLVFLFVPETKPTKEWIESQKNREDRERPEEGTLLSALLKRPELLWFSGITVLFFLVFSQFTYGVPLHANEIFGPEKAIKYGSLMTVNALAVCFLTVPITQLFQKRAPSWNLSLGGLFYVMGFGMLALVQSYLGMFISTLLWSIGEIFISTNTSVYIADHAPMTHRGRFNSVFPIIRKLGFGTGPLLMGFCISKIGIFSSWYVMAGISLVGSMGMFFLRKGEKQRASV